MLFLVNYVTDLFTFTTPVPNHKPALYLTMYQYQKNEEGFRNLF